MVEPGDYIVTIKAGDYYDKGKLKLIPDPVQPELDYAKRRANSTELFNMVEELGLLEAQVKSMKDTVDQRLPEVKNQKLKSKLDAYSNKMEEFRKILTETIESKGITGEQQLRARIGKLYVMTELSDNASTQSFVDGAKSLKEELKDAQTKANAYFDKELKELNTGLKKEKLGELKVLDEAEWRKRFDGNKSDSGS